MKKIFLIVFCLMLSGCAFAVYEQTDTVAFTSQLNLRMRFCLPANVTQTFEDGSKTIRKVLGYQGNHMCRYNEEQYSADGKLTKKKTCTFSQPQRLSLVRAAKSDMNSEDEVETVFKNFDSDVCKIETFED